ncbi:MULTISPECIES: hypothetical protein [Rothia]|uniref:hypothetical protein n=1 Tax=Rothia TaxID=32207 RepID=UPI001EE9591E|nr:MULTISPECIES: hypothetical protein [Rothia]
MNTRFLISPAYLLSIALLVAGAVLSGSRYMLIGWMLFLVGVFLNAMTLVILTNREQLRQIRQAHQHQKEQAEREQAGESPREPSAKELDVDPESQKEDAAEQDNTLQQGSEPESASDVSAVADEPQDANAADQEETSPQESTAAAQEQADSPTDRAAAVAQRTAGNAQSAQNMRRLKNSRKSRKPRKKSRR